MKTQLDMDKIAKGLGAERRGKVKGRGGYFGQCSSWPTSRRGSACPREADDQLTPDGPSDGSCLSHRRR